MYKFFKHNSIYTRSILTMLLFALLVTPMNVYAQTVFTNDESSSVTYTSTILPLTGSAIPEDLLPVSLTHNLNLYLVNSFTSGDIDVAEYNTILNSGLVSENAFFANSVFVGDSLTVGFENYCKRNPDSIATASTQFLARISCSAKTALSDNALTKHANIMPKYNGNVTYIEDAIAQMTNVNKVFICFGMNDLVVSTPEQFVADLQTLISKIIEKRPDVSIYVLSIPCITKDVSTGGLSNTSIQAANILLQNTCTTTGWGFINISEYLMGNNMAIRPEYSSDNYVHVNNKAYSIWNRVLKEYAYREIIK